MKSEFFLFGFFRCPLGFFFGSLFIKRPCYRRNNYNYDKQNRESINII